MRRFLISVVVLLAASVATATPIPSSREKPNALGFHQHQPKSSQHGYTGAAAAPLVADTTATNGEPTTGETSIATPPPPPGRIAPPDKTDKTKTPPPLGPGRIEPVDKTKTSPPEFCTTARMGGPELNPWGCAIKGPPKELPEPGTYGLLAVGLMAFWLVRSRRSRVGAARA